MLFQMKHSWILKGKISFWIKFFQDVSFSSTDLGKMGSDFQSTVMINKFCALIALLAAMIFL